jgi:undecaprenyl-diphosphatase
VVTFDRYLHRSRALLRWVGQRELGSLVAVSALALGALVFTEVASEVREGDAQRIDRYLLLALRNPNDRSDPLGPPWLEEMMRDLTALGGVAVLTLLTLAVLGYLLLRRKPRAAGFVAASIFGAALAGALLKSVFDRARPDLALHLSLAQSSSFPSGHSMLSAAVYFTLGALLARLEESVILKAYLLLCAAVLAFFVGLSRVYVGVHWPTDVLAGWAAGAAWAAGCWVVARRLQKKGSLERGNVPPSE